MNQRATPTVNIASPQVPGQITIIWNDFVTGEQGWRVQRSSEGVNFNWYQNVQITHSGGAQTGGARWTDTNLPDETVYYYRIRAYGNDVDTAYSAKPL